MMRLQFDRQIPVQYVGTLVLMGTKYDMDSSDDEQTIVYFTCHCPPDAPLSSYFYHWSFGDKDFITSSDEIESVEGNSKLILFTRTVKGKLEKPEQFLHVTANKLQRELQHAEDTELSMLELDDQMAWTEHHMNCDCKMPEFKRPRHV